MTRQLEDVGAVICAAGPGLVPAGKNLHAGAPAAEPPLILARLA